MASRSNVEIKIIAQDDASSSIGNVISKTKELEKENKKITKQSKKDWGGLGDLFGQVLPRNLQGLVRGFKSTQRQVGRLSKSFKVLKAAWASVGIGLIIIALEELITNWDDVSDAIMGVTKEQKRQEKVNKDVYEAQLKMNTSVKSYIELIAEGTLNDEERAVAIQKVNSELGNAITLNADINTQAQQAQDILDANQKLVAKEIDATSAKNTINEESIALREDEWSWYNKMLSGMGLYGLALNNELNTMVDRVEVINESKDGIKELTKAQVEAEAERNKVIKANEEALEAEAEAEKKAAEAQREAEAAYNKRVQKEKANAEWLAKERVRIAEEASLRIIEDDEKREQASLLIEQKKAEQELLDKGGTWQDLLRLGEEYEAERTAITDRYAEERKAKEEEDKMQDEADALELKTQLQSDQQNELDEIERFFAEKRLLTEKDSEEYKALVQQEADAVDAINTKYSNKTIEDLKKEQNAKIASAVAYGNAVRGVVGGLSNLMDENAKEQKALAITEVLLAQAISIAQAIKGANSAGATGGVAAPIITPLLMVQMVGSVLAGFAGVKQILNEAGASGGGGVSSGSFGGGGGSSVASMASNVQVPLPARLDSPDAMQAYVVQSQLDGQLQSQAQLQGQVVL